MFVRERIDREQKREAEKERNKIDRKIEENKRERR